jgi:Family of unknown function (DUF6455)
MGLHARAWTSLRRWVASWRPAQQVQARDERSPADPAVRALAEAVLARADAAATRAAARGDVSRMMQHFGIDPAEVPPQFSDRLRDAERLCARCASIGRCQRWSYREPTKDAPRLFCPNAELFDEIAASQGTGRQQDDPSHD